MLLLPKWLSKNRLIMFSFWCLSGTVIAETGDNSTNQETLLYDPVSGKMVTRAQLDRQNVQPLILETFADSVRLGELNLEQRGETLWVDFEELLTLLDFPIQVQQKEGTFSAQGWFIRPENRFQIEPSTTLAGHYDLQTPLQEEPVRDVLPKVIDIQSTQIWVELTEAMSWFSIVAKPNVSNLNLTLIPQQKLPIQERLLREQRQAEAMLSDYEVRLPRQDVPYQAFSPLFTDVQFSASRDNQSLHRLNLSLLGTGDLAYMTARYFGNLNYDERTQTTTPNLRLALERSSLDSDLLGPMNASYVSVLDTSTASIANLATGGKDFGARASNRPLGRITNSSTTTLSGFQQPGWEIELYLNGVFIDRQIVGDDGRYQFADKALSIGENNFTLKFYGPQGQRDEKTETYILDQNSLVGGNLIYDVSVSRQDWQLSDFFESTRQDDPVKFRFNSHFEKGINANLSATGDYSQYYFSDQTLHQFVQPGLRLFWNNTLLNAAWLKDLEAGHQTNLIIARGFGLGRLHKFNYSFTQNTEDFAINFESLATLKTSHTLGLQGPLNLGLSNKVNYQLTTAFSESFSNVESRAYGVNLGTQLAGVNIANNLVYNQYLNDKVESSSSSGNLQLSGRISRLLVRNSTQYSINPNSQINQSSLGLLMGFSGGWSSEVKYYYDFVSENLGENYALNWQNKDFIAHFNLGKTNQNYSASLIVRFAFGVDPLTKRMLVSSSSLANTAGVSALVFEDLNNNQRFDLNEPVIENAEVLAVQQHRRAKTDSVGVATIKGLYGNQPTDIKVNEQSLPDPFWIPSREGFSFLPRPGLVKTIFIPVVSAGEVEGTVRYSETLFSKPVEQGKVPILLTHKTNPNLVYRTQSAFDGYYLFDKVAPGSYLLQVDPDFLSKKVLKTRDPMPIEVSHRGALIMGANFELFAADQYEYKGSTSSNLSTEDIDANDYLVNLGTFSSEKNAQIVLKVLRNVFPSLWGGFSGAVPLEMSLEKTSQNQYVFWLGAFKKLDHVKYLCASLAQQGLVCEVKKVVKSTSSMIETNLPTPAVQSAELEVNPLKEVTLQPVALDLQSSVLSAGFTLQLLSVKNPSALRKFVEQHQLTDTWIEQSMLKGEPIYRLNLGRFADKETAQTIAQSLKKSKGISAWAKRFP